MTPDTSIYYVWIGGSCDYDHKERAASAKMLALQTKFIHKITFLNIFCIFGRYNVPTWRLSMAYPPGL